MEDKHTNDYWILFLIAISVTFIAFCATMVIYSMTSAINQGKQKRTMADMRAIGTALEAYHSYNKTFPVGKLKVADIASYLEPGYIKDVPDQDAWGSYFTTTNNSKITL